MELLTLPTDAMPDEKPAEQGQVAVTYSADDEAAVPSDDAMDWWLPNEAEMTGPNAVWRNCGEHWSPPSE